MDDYVTFYQLRQHIKDNTKNNALSIKLHKLYFKNYNTLFLGHIREDKILLEKNMINIYLKKHGIPPMKIV